MTNAGTGNATETDIRQPGAEARAAARGACRAAAATSAKHDERDRPSTDSTYLVLAEIGEDADRPQRRRAARRHQLDLGRVEREHQHDDQSRTAPRLSHSECRASFRAASARRECDGVRTSCASARPADQRKQLRCDSLGFGAMAVEAGSSLRALGAEDRNRDRACLARYYSRRCGCRRCSAVRSPRRAARRLRSERCSTSAKRQLPCLRKSAAPEPSVSSVEVPVMNTRLGS